MPLYNPSRVFANSDGQARTVFNFEVGRHFITGEQRTFNLLPQLHQIKCPTLILAGVQDPVCTIEDMQDVADAIAPGLVQFERFAEAGHGVFRDELEQALQLLRDFITA